MNLEPTTPAQAVSLTFKRPRPFLVRLGIGVGLSLRDCHVAINKFFWDSDDVVVIPFVLFGTVATTFLTMMFCLGLSAFSSLTFGALMSTWPFIVAALLPVELLGINIAINLASTIPNIFQALWKGLASVKDAIEKRIPRE